MWLPMRSLAFISLAILSSCEEEFLWDLKKESLEWKFTELEKRRVFLSDSPEFPMLLQAVQIVVKGNLFC